MKRRPPPSGKRPNPKPGKKRPKESVLIIDDIDDALRRIWQAKTRKK